MKKICVLAMVLLMAAVVLPGTAQSAMWVGGELGANWSSNADINVTDPFGTNTFRSVSVKPSVLGGVTLGYDFVNSGFGGYAYPDWMKYFSFATDFTYNRLSINNQLVNVNGFRGQVFFPGQGQLDGYLAAWSFLFIGHYGFYPDSEVPSGRVVPYIGVGPGILFSGVKVKDAGSHSATNIALVTEAGVRFMALSNVSIDLAFRYRYAKPSYDFTDAVGVTTNVGFTANEFSVLSRVSYHF